jgi:hypothetical protein
MIVSAANSMLEMRNSFIVCDNGKYALVEVKSSQIRFRHHVICVIATHEF